MLNCPLEEIEKAKIILLVCSNLRMENPLLNSRIRKNYLNNPKLKVFSIGLAVNYTTLPIINLGNSPVSLARLSQWRLNKVKEFCFTGFIGLHNFNHFIEPKPLVLVGSGLLGRSDFAGLNKYLLSFCSVFPSSSVYNVIPDTLGKISVAEVGLTKTKELKHQPVGLSYNIATSLLQPAGFIVYQGAQLPTTVTQSSLLLPTCLHTERLSTYINVQGKIRLTKIGVTPYRQALTDVEIFKLMSILKPQLVPHNFSSLPNFNKTISNCKALIKYETKLEGNIEPFLRSFHRTSGFELRKPTR